MVGLVVSRMQHAQRHYATRLSLDFHRTVTDAHEVTCVTEHSHCVTVITSSHDVTSPPPACTAQAPHTHCSTPLDLALETPAILRSVWLPRWTSRTTGRIDRNRREADVRAGRGGREVARSARMIECPSESTCTWRVT